MRPDAFDPPRERLVRFGALVPARVARGEWWRVATAALLHHDVAHLAGNAVGLLVLGAALASAASPARFAIVAAGAGVGGNLAQFEFGPPAAVTIGASGMVFGLLGALIAWRAHEIRADRRALRSREYLRLFGFALLALLGVGRPGHTAWLAHAGGFLAGVLLAPRPRVASLRMVAAAQDDDQDWRRWN